LRYPAAAELSVLSAALACVLNFPLHAYLQSPDEPDNELSRDAAEQQLSDLQEQIRGVHATLEEARTEYSREQGELRELDLQLDRYSKDVRGLESQQEAQRTELARLESDRQEHLETMASQKDQLAEVLRSAYRLDRHSRLKLVLNQDNPSELSRMLAYYEYFNQHHFREISALRKMLAKLEQMHELITAELSKLETTRQSLLESLEQLNQKRQARLDLIADLDKRIGSGEARLAELERNRQDLVLLLERLEDGLADIPADLGARLGVAQQKGHLPIPVAGRVHHAFGQRRGGSMYWQGWLIAADPGSDVHSVAYGRVAFADWLRGYGLIVIIDHGDGFLSLYGNNESLLAEVGDWVEPGELISVVGSNPGMSQGLYFELRKDGKAVDPAAWIQR
jgi:septal ring factor EnvC (AmiA/AmiB activator)